MDIKKKQQQFLEMAVMAIVTQGGPSKNDEGGCEYQGLEGRRCHIGVFVNVSRPGVYVEHLPEDVLGPVKELGMEFLSSFQSVHDDTGFGVFFWRDYAANLETFCRNFDLRYPGELL